MSARPDLEGYLASVSECCGGAAGERFCESFGCSSIVELVPYALQLEQDAAGLRRVVNQESIACAYCSFEIPAPTEAGAAQVHVLVCEFNPLGIRLREMSVQAAKLIIIVRHIIRHDLLGQADQERLALEDASARLAALLEAAS